MDWLEILVPLIFALIYILGNIFGNKNPDEDDASRKRDRSESGGDDPADLQRRIQEEIRRKIRQRQGGEGASGQEGPASAPQTETAPPRYDPHQPEQPRAHEPERQSRPQPESADEPLRQPEPARTAYEDQIQEQLKEIEETRKRAAVLQEKARKVKKTGGNRGEIGSPSRPRTVRGGQSHQSLRDAVLGLSRDPDAARKAILYMEVLGTPVGMRRNGKMGPLWEG
ncbi:MAG: hypothetical protein ACFE0O_13135 [Opitutales bacterium]